jgi:hypothetical protein
MAAPERFPHFCDAENEGKEGKFSIFHERIMRGPLSTV